MHKHGYIHGSLAFLFKFFYENLYFLINRSCDFFILLVFSAILDQSVLLRHKSENTVERKVMYLTAGVHPNVCRNKYVSVRIYGVVSNFIQRFSI